MEYQTIDFLSPRFLGKRFEDHSIPLEILKDLSVFEEMVNEVAKWLYLEEHPDRLRVPRGFTNEISIKLQNIQKGSAIPKLVLVILTLPSLFASESQNYFEKARDKIISSIDAAENNKRITEHLPEHLLVYFDRIGRSLLDEEVIEFKPNDLDHPARLNKITRKSLLASSKVKEYSEEIILNGSIPEADQDKNIFTLLKKDSKRIIAPLDPIIKNIVLKAFNDYQNNQEITLKGIGRFNSNSELERIESIEHIQLVDKLDISNRLAELTLLKDGWLDGKGKALNRSGINWLEKTFESLYEASLPLPRIFPTAEGGVQAEWSINNWEISLEIDLDSKYGEFQALEIDSGAEIEEKYNLNESFSWGELNKNLKKIIGELK
ncbi:MAG TPA: hypothetical protein DHW82_11785 [Spirochaetia bacterium]|nr:MAG: hypothetical protein A2Y41_08970 [Spirochaetes bacterium GWB1_36_13]HCL57672.1 hypothetical protein [Spirochaetia bacterium]